MTTPEQAEAIERLKNALNKDDPHLTRPMQDIHTLLSLLDSLKRDGERLDWLEQNQFGIMYNMYSDAWVVGSYYSRTRKQRDAIDSAISAQQKGKV